MEQGRAPTLQAGAARRRDLSRAKASHVADPIGHERVTHEGYLQRKMADTGVTRRDYVNVHHLIWREAGNDIPPGHILIFRDGNKANFALENLELITRKENMRRNSVHNLPKELAELCQLKGHCSARSTQNKRQNDMTQPTIGDVRDLLFAQMKALSKPDATSETLDKSGDGRAGADHHQLREAGTGLHEAHRADGNRVHPAHR